MAIEKVKCTNCKGTGLIPSNKFGKRYVVCPICKGTGKKNIYKPDKIKIRR